MKSARQSASDRGNILKDRQIRDRVKGALLGLATGDALGTTLEFRPRDSYEPLTDMVGGGPFQLPVGTWTDDTSMALALATSLCACGRLDPVDLMTRFVAWWRKGEYSPTGACCDIGMTTRNALAHFEATGEALAGSRDPNSAGNGSLMRLAPVAIWGVGAGEDAMREAARLQSATTHAARACLDACEAWAVILRNVMLGARIEKAIAKAGTLDFGDPISAIIAGSWRDKRRDDIRSSGYVAHSLEASLWCVGQGGTFRDMVLRAANLGEDADTTAAITGQLAGAMYGASGIPEVWLTQLAWRDQIETLALNLLRGKTPDV